MLITCDIVPTCLLCLLITLHAHMLAQWVAAANISSHFYAQMLLLHLSLFFCTHAFAFAASVVGSSEGGNAIQQCSRHCRKGVKNEERMSFTCSSSEGGVPTGALRRKHTTSPNNTSLDALVCTNTSQGLTANTGTLQIQIQAQIEILQSNLRLTIPVPSA